MNNVKIWLVLGIGFVAGVALTFFSMPAHEAVATSSSDEKKPLYWVAPMDANYRRDKPGKSPMGMDLVPVYENGADDVPGTVRISPEVVNNLGVRIKEVVSIRLRSDISTVGYVRYNEENLIHLHPRVEGWIEELFVDAAGDPVTKGQPIYSIYSPTLVNAQEELLLALDRKNQRLIQASLDRLRSLQLDEESINALMEDRNVKQRIVIKSPQSGVIDNLNIREGFFIRPDTTLMSIGALDDVWVDAEVFERQAGLVSEGDRVSMTLDYLPGRTWEGLVDYVYPTLNAETRTAKVRLRFDNRDFALKPNMFVQVEIFTARDKPVVAVPREAVIRTGHMNRVVLSEGNGRFRSVEVKTGHSDRTNIEVLEGVDKGDLVVVSAHFLIDSESAKSADFARMDGASMVDHSSMNDGMVESNQSLDDETQRPEAEVEGMINTIDDDSRIINISRGPIAKWNRGPATMDFMVADDIDLSLISSGDQIQFVFVIDAGDFVVTQIKSPADHAGHGEME